VPESLQTAAEESGVDYRRFCTQLLIRLHMGLTDEDIKKHRRSQGVQWVHLHPSGRKKFFSGIIYRENV